MALDRDAYAYRMLEIKTVIDKIIAESNDTESPLAGMPILMAHEANNVVVIKRSLSPGYAGVKNKLFERDNTVMLFSDAKVALQETLSEMKDAA